MPARSAECLPRPRRTTPNPGAVRGRGVPAAAAGRVEQRHCYARSRSACRGRGSCRTTPLLCAVAECLPRPRGRVDDPVRCAVAECLPRLEQCPTVRCAVVECPPRQRGRVEQCPTVRCEVAGRLPRPRVVSNNAMTRCYARSRSACRGRVVMSMTRCDARSAECVAPNKLRAQRGRGVRAAAAPNNAPSPAHARCELRKKLTAPFRKFWRLRTGRSRPCLDRRRR
jgi:hypothetical protein